MARAKIQRIFLASDVVIQYGCGEGSRALRIVFKIFHKRNSLVLEKRHLNDLE